MAGCHQCIMIHLCLVGVTGAYLVVCWHWIAECSHNQTIVTGLIYGLLDLCSLENVLNDSLFCSNFLILLQHPVVYSLDWLILFFLVLTASFLLVIQSKNGIRRIIICVEVCNLTAACIWYATVLVCYMFFKSLFESSKLVWHVTSKSILL